MHCENQEDWHSVRKGFVLILGNDRLFFAYLEFFVRIDESGIIFGIFEFMANWCWLYSLLNLFMRPLLLIILS